MDIYMDNFIKEICRGMDELCKVNFTYLKIVFCVLQVKENEENEDIREAFRVFDRDGDGYLIMSYHIIF